MMNETDSEFSDEIDSSSSDESSSNEEDQPLTSTNIAPIISQFLHFNNNDKYDPKDPNRISCTRSDHCWII